MTFSSSELCGRDEEPDSAVVLIVRADWVDGYPLRKSPQSRGRCANLFEVSGDGRQPSSQAQPPGTPQRRSTLATREELWKRVGSDLFCKHTQAHASRVVHKVAVVVDSFAKSYTRLEVLDRVACGVVDHTSLRQQRSTFCARSLFASRALLRITKPLHVRASAARRTRPFRLHVFRRRTSTVVQN